MVSYSNSKNRYCTDCYRLSQVLESFPLENLRVKTVNDREPFGANRSEVFPVPEPFRPVPVPVFSTIDQKPSNAVKHTVLKNHLDLMKIKDKMAKMKNVHF